VWRAARYSDCETGDGETTNTRNNPFKADGCEARWLRHL